MTPDIGVFQGVKNDSIFLKDDESYLKDEESDIIGHKSDNTIVELLKKIVELNIKILKSLDDLKEIIKEKFISVIKWFSLTKC